jgi:hypothetical protein
MTAGNAGVKQLADSKTSTRDAARLSRISGYQLKEEITGRTNAQRIEPSNSRRPEAVRGITGYRLMRSGSIAAEGSGKNLVEVICGSCHSTERIVSRRWTRPQWQDNVNKAPRRTSKLISNSPPKTPPQSCDTASSTAVSRQSAIEEGTGRGCRQNRGQTGSRGILIAVRPAFALVSPGDFGGSRRAGAVFPPTILSPVASIPIWRNRVLWHGRCSML